MITILYILACLLILINFIPLIRNDYWTFRVFEYPRIQKLSLTVLLFIAIVALSPVSTWTYILKAALLMSIAYLSYQILPFTPIWKKQILSAKHTDRENSISILVSNVYEDNTNYAGCIQTIRQADADIVVLLETNEKWAEELKALDEIYSYAIKEPLNNTYGMIFYSKMELSNSSIEYLVESDIPSIHTQVRLPSGQQVQFYALHPTPPVPNENERSTERDKELLLIAEKAEQHPLPVIVCGDMNDVAWSYTTELFLKMSQLLDPRRGRGLINTFHAHYPFLRFPLDHIFVSQDFKLQTFKRLDNFDSDHFPIYTALQYEAQASTEQRGLEQTEEDKELAEDKKNKS